MSVDRPRADTASYTLDPGRTQHLLLCCCVGIEIGLFLADTVFTYFNVTGLEAVRRLFNLTREDSLPALFNIAQLLLLTLTLWLIVITERRRHGRYLVGWLVIALFYSYLSIDDGSMLHERLGTAFEVTAGDTETGMGSALLDAFPSYPWQILFMPVFAAVGLYMLHFLRGAFADPANFKLFFDGLLLYATAVLLDFIEGLPADHPLNAFSYLRTLFDLTPYTVSHFNKTVEETLEMLGTTVIWLAFLRHFMQQNPVLQVRFGSTD